MSKCKNCGIETSGKFCPACGEAIEPTEKAIGEAELSAEDKALEEKIKRDWYIKTWRSEKPNERWIKFGVSFVSIIIVLIGIALVMVAFWKYTKIKDTLMQSDPLLLLFVYKDITGTIYTLIILGISLITIGVIADSFATQWEVERLLQWHDKLNIDTRKLAVDIILAGKSHAMYNNAAVYLYNRAHNIVKLTTWKSRIIKNTIGFCIAIAAALGACFYVKSDAEQTLKRIIAGTINVPTAGSSSSGIDPTIIILIVLLAILIVVLLIIPIRKMKKNAAKIDSWIETQIQKGSLNNKY